MRGADISQPSLFVAKTVNDFVPKTHPLRALRALIDEALVDLDELFDSMYSDIGKASIAPERLIRASLLQVLYTIRSERQLVEHIQYNMLYRWFVGLELDDMVWDHSTFSKNRERLLDHQVMPALFESVLKLARKRQLLSAEHFSVDGTLIQAWASHKSFRPKDDDDNTGASGRERDFRGQRRSNDTHASTTDPEAELMRKSAGQEARLSYGVDHLMENRNTLVVRVVTRRAATVHERAAGLAMVKAESGGQRITVGGDCGYDTAAFIEDCRTHNVTPHVAQNVNRRGGSALDERTTRHPGYAVSQRKRKMIETTFGWAKQYGGLRRTMVRGLDRVAATVTFTMAVFNLMRIRNIELATQSG
jgi:transposase